jgi:hypothetical protein
MTVFNWLRGADKIYKLKAQEMLNELNASYFEVGLCPAPFPKHSGHSIRVSFSHNPLWYSRLCSNHTSKRGRMKRPRTYIVRSRVVFALERIIDGRGEGIYYERIIDTIKRELELKFSSPVGYDEHLPF